MKVLSFGEVLWDVYPDEKFLGGAPLNFAAHLAKHGKAAYMVSSVGDDALGEEAVSQMRRWGVRTDYVSCSSEKETGKCLVTLDARSVPSYNLLRDVAYDQIRCDNIPDTFDVLYFGTLALRSEGNFKTLKALLSENHYKEVFVDINIRPPFCSDAVVTFAVANATMLKISEEELPAVCNALGMSAATAYRDFAQMLAQHHEKLKCILVTLGADGAYVLDCRQQEDWISGSAEVEVVSTVGAGDSFSAAFLAKYMDGCSMDDCLNHAIHVAGYVVSRFDAVPDYIPEEIHCSFA